MGNRRQKLNQDLDTTGTQNFQYLIIASGTRPGDGSKLEM